MIPVSIYKPLAFIKKDFIESASYKFAFITQFIGIVFTIILFYFLSKLLGAAATPYLAPYGGNYFSFVLIGIAFSNYLGISLSSFSAIISGAQVSGTLEALLVTQTEVPAIIIYSSLYSFIITSVRVILYILLGSLFFGMQIGNANYFGALLILILTIVAFSSIGIISASFIMILKKGDPFTWIFGSVSWFLGGVYYPISVLPDWLRNFSYLLPITYSLEGMRMALIQGHSLYQLAPNILALLLFSFLMLPLSIVIFKYAVKKAKRDGSLTHY